MIVPTYAAQTWTAPDGEIFSWGLWQPTLRDSVQAVVIAVHGLSGAALDFEPLAVMLARENIVTAALELRAQGNDPQVSRRGDLGDFRLWFQDLDVFFKLVRDQFPGQPIYYYGESMGAALLTRYLTQDILPLQPEGLVLASPVIALATPVPLWLEVIFQTISWVHPRLRIDVRWFTKKGEGPKLVTRDETHRLWFETAPHRLTIFTLRFFKELRKLISGCMAAAPFLRPPLLLIYPGKDIFIPTELVEKFFQLVGSPEKEARFYPESYHLLLHDSDQAEVLGQIRSWVLQRLKKDRSSGAKVI